MAKPRAMPQTLDMVTGDNIRRIRDQHRWSRTELAERLSSIIGNEVSAWRLIDLEGARSRTKPPRAVTWPELVALALAFEVPIYDLVIPAHPDAEVVIAAALPDVDTLTRPDGTITTRSIRHVHRSGRREMLDLLFRVPGKSYELEGAFEDIHHLQEGLERTLETLARLTEEAHDAIKENRNA